MLGGSYVPTHRICVEQHGASAKARATEALKGNYFTGFVGAVLGGLVGAIPAILCLNFLDYYVAYLYALIPLGAYFGYRTLKGKMNSGALVCSVIASLLNLFTVEFVSVYIQWAQYIGDLPTLGYAWRVFQSYVQDSAFIGGAVMDLVFLGLGIFFTWGQIRRTAVHDVQDAGLAGASLLVNGKDPAPQAAATAATDSGYHMVQPTAPHSGGDDPWDN